MSEQDKQRPAGAIRVATSAGADPFFRPNLAAAAPGRSLAPGSGPSAGRALVAEGTALVEPASPRRSHVGMVWLALALGGALAVTLNPERVTVALNDVLVKAEEPARVQPAVEAAQTAVDALALGAPWRWLRAQAKALRAARF